MLPSLQGSDRLIAVVAGVIAWRSRGAAMFRSMFRKLGRIARYAPIIVCIGIFQSGAGPAQTSAPNEKYGIGYLQPQVDGRWPPYPRHTPSIYGWLSRSTDAEMTERERRLFAGWATQLPPGLYRFRSYYQQLNRVSESCLGFVPGAGTEAPRLGLMPCSRPEATLAVLSHDGPGNILQSPGHGCVTLARGVVLGAARIDVLPCDYVPGLLSAQVSAFDQAWYLNIERSSRWGTNIEQRFGMDWGEAFRIGQGTGNKCWEVRPGGDVVLNECRHPYDVPVTPLVPNPRRGTRVPGEVPTQSFTIEPAGPLPADLAAQQRELGWEIGPLGRMRRAVGVPGFDMPGGDIARLPTADDNGFTCANQCRQNRDCDAFTWVPPGMQEASAICYLKGGPRPPIVRNRATVSGLTSWLPGRPQSIDPALRERIGDVSAAPGARR